MLWNVALLPNMAGALLGSVRHCLCIESATFLIWQACEPELLVALQHAPPLTVLVGDQMQVCTSSRSPPDLPLTSP